MAHLQVCSPHPNGVVLREDCPCTSPPSSPLPPSIGPESWARAEQTTHDIVSKIQPTLVAHQKRKDIIQYVQSLITCNVGCQVFPYGSVPLKTYLPDGDIDLTAFGSANIEDAYVADVHAVLKREENNEAAPYHVKDVHLIDAELLFAEERCKETEARGRKLEQKLRGKHHRGYVDNINKKIVETELEGLPLEDVIIATYNEGDLRTSTFRQ